MAKPKKLRRVLEDRRVQALASSAAVAATGALAAGTAVRHRRLNRVRSRRYRLDPQETPTGGVGRVARGQFDLAIELLEGDSDHNSSEATHEARKALKRLRALLRLSRPLVGDDRYRRENVLLRDTGRSLSAARDAQVLVETLDAITMRFADQLGDAPFARFRQLLADQRHAAVDRNDGRAATALIPRLAGARLRVLTWELAQTGGPEQLADGFERIYRRGRRARKAAAARPDSQRLHELRKRAKDLWHGAQLLRTLHPKRMRRLQRRAHRLSDLLGDDHDLAVLCERATEHPECFEPGELDVLIALIDRRRQAFQRAALKCGARIYRRKPRQLMRRLTAS